MTDVSYRINVNRPVKVGGATVATNSPLASGSFQYFADNGKTLANEHNGSGLANRFDDKSYYSS